MHRTRVIFSSAQAAAGLWTYGEDAHIKDALELQRDEFDLLWAFAGTAYDLDPERVPHPRPLALDAVTALACVRNFEGRWRQLTRQRRRAHKTMPAHLAAAQPVPMSRVTDDSVIDRRG